ncbi:helix-turn-helix transcriptional regulator [Parasphingorhabdus sp.]|uniref:helix-turn-helix transcriptional regulator n=1 Tax=Parasphingorhabdus sp. TaxID=2709688 RepID=UPI003BB20A85
MLDADMGEVSDHASARLLRLSEVQHRVGLGRSTIYRWMEDGKFPRPHSIGGYSVRWLESDIDGWIASKTLLDATS